MNGRGSGRLLAYAPLAGAAALGLWLLASPYLLGYDGPARTNHLIAGPLVASFGTIALGAATRGIRWVDVVIGIWLAVSAFLLPHPPAAFWSGLIAGIGIAVLSLAPGPARPSFGGGWRALIDTDRLAGRG